MKPKDELKILLDSLNEKVEDIELNARIIKEQPESKQSVTATQFLEREWSQDGRSGFRSILKHIQEILSDKPVKQKKEIEKRIEVAQQRVQKAISITGEIFPGEACRDFVISCNRRKEKIVMRTIEPNGFEQDSVFRIKETSDMQWDIIRQLVESDSYPMHLELPNGRDITNIFRGSKY